VVTYLKGESKNSYYLGLEYGRAKNCRMGTFFGVKEKNGMPHLGVEGTTDPSKVPPSGVVEGSLSKKN